MSYALFISRDDIIKNTPLQGAINADALIPFVRTAQDKYLKNLLGTVLFNYYQTRIQSSIPFGGRYKELLDEHIKYVLLWYAAVEYIPFSAVQFKSNGATKQISEQSVAPSKSEIDYLLNKAKDNAEYYALRLQDFCVAYSNEIPEYLQSVGNSTQIYPDKSNQYFTGIQL